MRRTARTIDLHAHTDRSDGLLSPDALVELAAESGVETLAVTDHDTTDALVAARAAGARLGVRIVCGVELTAHLDAHQMHLVSYFPGLPSDVAVARLAELKAARVDRARAMVERLRALGVQIAYDEVAARAPGVVARPHIADALVASGVVASRAEAFDRYLADGMPAFVPGGGLTADEAISLVHGEGGAVCLAHPGTLKLSAPDLDSLVGVLAGAGLDGIEVHRPEHQDADRRQYRWLAERYGLIPTGGSDFHAPGLGPVLGKTGTPPLPRETAVRLMRRAAR